MPLQQFFTYTPPTSPPSIIITLPPLPPIPIVPTIPPLIDSFRADEGVSCTLGTDLGAKVRVGGLWVQPGLTSMIT